MCLGPSGCDAEPGSLPSVLPGGQLAAPESTANSQALGRIFSQLSGGVVQSLSVSDSL